MIERDLKRYASRFRDYTELRFQQNRNLDINLLNGELTSNRRTSLGGISARVRKNGSWGFASAPGMDGDGAAYCIRTAADNAGFLAARRGEGKGWPKTPPVRSGSEIRTLKPKKTHREIMDFLRELDSHIVSSCRNLKSRRLWFGALEYEKSLLTSDGSEVYSMIPRTRVIVFLSGEKDGKKADVNVMLGNGSQFEDAFPDRGALFAEIDALGEHLNKKLDGIYPEAGTWDCVLAPELSGLLAHEAVGHTVEADNVMAGAVTKELMGCLVADPMVGLSDFAYSAFGKPCPVPLLADDEGIEAKDAEIIKDGILNSFLHNRESAARFGAVPSGNARASLFSDEPVIRMRNTAILPGRSRYEDLISSVDDGFLLLINGNGQADSTGEFTFGVIVGYEIKKGRIGRAIRDTTVSGVAYDVLRSVSMVSDRFKWLHGGMCYKPQLVTVGMGGPDLRCRLRVGGN
jgi:TldD protein